MNKIETIIIMIGIYTTLYSQSTWEKFFGHEGDESGNYVIVDSLSSHFIIAGRTNSFSNFYVPYILKIDENGTLLEEHYYTLFYSGGFYCISPTYDGGYIATGRMYLSSTTVDLLLVKFDANFHIQWYKTFGGNYEDEGKYVVQTSDKGYLITGDTRTYGGNYIYDIYVVKTDSLGNLKWQKIIDSSPTLDDHGKYCVESEPGKYVIIGNYGGSYTQPFKAYFAKLDSMGNIIWQYISNVNYDIIVRSGCKTRDGGFVATGASGPGVFTVIKVDSTGSLVFNNLINYTTGAYYIIEHAYESNRFIITGPTSGLDLYILKTYENATGIEWVRTYAPPEYDFYQGNCVKNTRYGYIVAGYAWNYNGTLPDTGDVYVVSTNESGVKIKEKNISQKYISFIENEFSFLSTKWEIYSVSGKEIKITNKKLPKGIYFLNIKNEMGEIKRFKLIKIK